MWPWQFLADLSLVRQILGVRRRNILICSMASRPALEGRVKRQRRSTCSGRLTVTPASIGYSRIEIKSFESRVSGSTDQCNKHVRWAAQHLLWPYDRVADTLAGVADRPHAAPVDIVTAKKHTMSYPGLQSYNGYPASSSGDQGQYGARQSNAQYHDTPRPAQQSNYSSSGYNWPSQSGQNYSNPSSDAQNGYGGSNWRASSAQQQTSHDYQRQPADYGASSSMNGTYFPSSQAQTPSSTSALNNLAYASGLESAGMQMHNPSASPTFNQARNTGYQQPRTHSPAQTAPTTYQYPNPEHHSQSQQSLAGSAAAALAGAVRAQQRATQSPVNGSSQNAYGSNMGHSSSKLSQTTNYSNQKLNTSSTSNQSAYTLTPPSITTHPKTLSTQSKATASNSTQQKRTSTPAASTTKTQNKQSKTSIAKNSSSIANLVTDDNTANASTSNFVQSADPPNFIDPSQVFNPYHKEYERQRQLASEAEAAAKRKATETPAAVNPGAAKSPKQKKSSGKAATGAKKSSSSGQTSASIAEPIVEGEYGEMEAEMRLMLEKMMKYKSKDPATFQKLWDGLRKGASVAKPAVPISSPNLSVAQVPQDFTHVPQPPPAPDALTGSETQDKSKRHWDMTMVIENNPEGLPDLGRFPAERRNRGPNKSRGLPAAAEIPQLPQAAPTSQHVGQPVPQPLSPKAANGGTIWPPEKRKALAEAAERALMAIPENRDKNITADLIQSMLEQNPSYIDICILLEGKGLKFNRGQFARNLLSHVPDLTQNKQEIPKAFPQVPMAYIGPTMHGAGSPPTPMHPTVQNGFVKPEYPRQPSTGAFIGYQPPHHGSPAIITPKPLTAKKNIGTPASNVPTPAPGPKEAMARKRTFADLVDLTALDNDDDYVQTAKQPRLEEQQQDSDPYAVKLENFQKPTNGFGNASLTPFSPPYPGQPYTGGPAYNAPSMPPEPPAPKRTRALLARPVNKSEALKKSYYDPKTIARDVLIAAGRHPTERPLNSHLAGLLGTHIEIDSDLSTFDWDEVDPGGPPMPRVQLIDIPAGPPRWSLGTRRVMKVDREDNPSQMPRPTHSGTGPPRATEDPTLPGNLLRLQSLSKTLYEDSKRLNPNINISTPIAPSKLRESQTARASPLPIQSQNATPLAIRPSNSSAPNSSPKSTLMDGERRRGRPPGSKNKHPSVTTLRKEAKQVTKATASSAAPTTIEDLPRPEFVTFDCEWRKCSAKLHNLATLRKHVSLLHRQSDKDIEEDGGHICWWKRCSTHKRNPDKTITPTHLFDDYEAWLQHIESEHLEPIAKELGDGPRTQHTGKRTNDTHSLPSKVPVELKLSRYMYSEPKKSHYFSSPIEPHSVPHEQKNVQMHLARTSSDLDPQEVETDRTRYLSNASGLQQTPLSTLPAQNDYDPDVLPLYSTGGDPSDEETRREKFMAFNKEHGNEKMDLRRSALSVFESMVKRKEMLPAVDRGGCTLVTEARRATLVQDANIARVVDEDY